MKENWVVTWTFPRVSIYQAFEVENFNQAYQKGKHFLTTTFMVNLNQAYLESLVKPGFKFYFSFSKGR